MAPPPTPQLLRDVQLAEIFGWSTERVRERLASARAAKRRHLYDWWSVRELVSPGLLASSKTRCLAIRTSDEWLAGYPELVEQWHAEKNGGILPFELRYRSNRRCWWRCALGHEWQALVSERTRGSDCPTCSNDRRKERKPSSGDSLQERHPGIAVEWHPTSNGSVTPLDVRAQSHRRVWWKCPTCNSDWRGTVASRALKKMGCPACAAKERGAQRARAKPENSLATCAPNVTAEWDQAANGSLTPDDVNVGTRRKVTWTCATCARSWVASVAARARVGQGCPWCARERRTGPRPPRPESSLAACAPRVAREWDHEKNGDLRPEDVSRGSKLVVWWRCWKAHAWRAAIDHRTVQGSGCPLCPRARPGRTTPAFDESLAARAPEIAAEWDHERNGGLSPATVFANSKRHVWWRCNCGHSWQEAINKRARSGCAACAMPKRDVRREESPAVLAPSGAQLPEDSLGTFAPEIASEWHPERNGALRPSDVSRASRRVVWWRCSRGHEWQVAVSQRTAHRTRCPACPRMPAPKQSLAQRAPDIAAQWDHDQNAGLSPEAVFGGSKQRVWWRCAQGHSWQAAVRERVGRGRGCPRCRTGPSAEKSLAMQAPEIANEWDARRNGTLTPLNVFKDSKQRVWWQCARGHSWQAEVHSRTRTNATGCPRCNPGNRAPADSPSRF
ncbi:zinc-ribbon domain-containing protein [Pendulispora brunnea]|uniref:zinc-ribbon domain-containing protein n=1 Tax=Pendulispora brunnea TaxID=2905690 RepID=UPI00374E08C4